MRYLILVLLLLTSLPCISSIYMQKDSDGDVTYTDIPLNNAQPISLSPTNSVPSTTPPATAPANNTTTTTSVATEEEKTEVTYKTFAIISPVNNDTIQNQPIITVKIAIEPELRAGDTIQVYLDGKAWGTPVSSTSIDLTNVERGEHTLSAKLFDNTQNMLKQTEAIKIFVHRASANFKAAFARQANLAELILR